MENFANRFNGRQHIRLLLQWRWLVLAIAIPVSLVIEILEGESRGLHLLDEVVIDGLVLPVTTWAVLTFAARNIARQFKREELLEQRQRLMQCLAEHREFGDLAQFVVRFPATLLPIDYAALFLFDSEQARLDFVTHWYAAGSAGSTPSQYLIEASACHNCLANCDSGARRVDVCGFVTSHVRVAGDPEYCVPLVHEQRLVGVLRLHYQPGKQPAAEQLEFVTMLAPEIALALTLAIEDYRHAEQTYREAQVQERRRIAHELHDTLAQQIFYLHLSLDQLADNEALLMSEATRRRLESLRDVAATVYDQVRNNLSVLRTWEQVDLSEAVSEMARLTGHDNDLAIEIAVHGKAQWLSPHTSEHLYGVVREALNNVVKHARAQQVVLELDWSVDQLLIVLSDDGTGFDVQQASAEGHYGLTLMREAVEALQGVLTIDSRPGGGTCLRVAIPLRQPSSYSLLQKTLSGRSQLQPV